MINFTTKVSSVLNRDSKSYGKKYLTDGNSETCWNSDAGLGQYIICEFPTPTKINSMSIEFQGGFVGKNCELLEFYEESEWKSIMSFYPLDVNSIQRFQIPDSKVKEFQKLKILFHESTDFYGRITIYRLEFQ